MPHIIVEYSNNIEEASLDLPGLLERLADVAVATGLFPEKGMRLRAYRADFQRVGAGHPEQGFLHVGMKVGKGRTEAARQEAGATLFEALKAHLSDAMSGQTISLSLEMRELDPVKFNYRND